jgi:hypothetical protein
MKLKTLPNGNLNLEGIGFVSQTGFHCKIGEFELQTSTVTGNDVPCHYVSWTDEDGDIQRHALEYDSIVDCFRKKIWRVKHVGKPVKMFSKFKF